MKNRVLTIMLIILISITLIGVVTLIVTTQLKKGEDNGEPTIDEIIEASVDVPEITTNLAGEESFVRISLKIQTDNAKAAEELAKRDFQVKNIVIQELSEMTAEDLDGKEGKQSLENALKMQLNELMQEGKVQKVYITSYIIQ